VRTY